MDLASEIQDQVVIISIDGDIDAATAPSVAEYVGEIMEERWSKVVFDLGGVRFMSSAGLRILLNAHQRGKEVGSAIVLAQPQAGVLKVLKTAGIAQILPCYDTVEEAKAA